MEFARPFPEREDDLEPAAVGAARRGGRGGLFRGETARTCLYVVPLLALPAGMESAQWPIGPRLAALVGCGAIVAAIYSNMVFVSVKPGADFSAEFVRIQALVAALFLLMLGFGPDIAELADEGSGRRLSECAGISAKRSRERRERLSREADGRVVLSLCRPLFDGTTAVAFTPTQLLKCSSRRRGGQSDGHCS